MVTDGDIAGPSGAGKDNLGKSVEETQELFDTGVECIKRNDLETAADIFDQVLRARIARYGELADVCASSYCRYGSVLLYQAQDNADVFGAQINTGVRQDIENKENSEDMTAVPTDLGSKGKAAVAEAEEAQPKSNAVGVDQGAMAADATDLQIAWENLDTARAIWEKNPEKNAESLANVHSLLGDVGLENEAFEDSLIDYGCALRWQTQAGFADDDRRTAELFFKRVMALQFLDRPEEALNDVEEAEKVLNKKLNNLSSEARDANAAEILDVKAILEDLRDKKGELHSQVEEKAAVAEAVKGALSQFKKATQDINPFGDATAQGTSLVSNKSNTTSPVKDLGVVGRGTKRINLNPVDGATPATGKPQTDGKGEDGEAAKKPRTLQTLMGEDKGDTTIGFGK